MTFVFVTHDQEEALTMSDRIAVFNHGRLEQLGAATEIYHQPRTRFVADFIGEANLLPAEFVALDRTRVRVRIEGGLELVVSADRWPAGLARALISIRPEKVHVSKQAVAGENVFEARVTDELFQGALDRLGLELAGGTRLAAVVANESALREAIYEGDRVWCGLHVDDLVIVRAD